MQLFRVILILSFIEDIPIYYRVYHIQQQDQTKAGLDALRNHGQRPEALIKKNSLAQKVPFLRDFELVEMEKHNTSGCMMWFCKKMIYGGFKNYL